MLEQPPLGLYIHIPWCIRKCPYCDFNSHQANGAIQERDYITKLFDDFLYEFLANEQARSQRTYK